ncbi:MAG: hypothetical protein QY311_03325 [Candidatus Paceibacterota bacterium]|nr:MAG: hypothetical protein QY311_03325 [Candidatus Paceibacterota bacterium]
MNVSNTPEVMKSPIFTPRPGWRRFFPAWAVVGALLFILATIVFFSRGEKARVDNEVSQAPEARGTFSVTIERGDGPLHVARKAVNATVPLLSITTDPAILLLAEMRLAQELPILLIPGAQQTFATSRVLSILNDAAQTITPKQRESLAPYLK